MKKFIIIFFIIGFLVSLLNWLDYLHLEPSPGWTIALFFLSPSLWMMRGYDPIYYLIVNVLIYTLLGLLAGLATSYFKISNKIWYLYGKNLLLLAIGGIIYDAFYLFRHFPIPYSVIFIWIMVIGTSAITYTFTTNKIYYLKNLFLNALLELIIPVLLVIIFGTLNPGDKFGSYLVIGSIYFLVVYSISLVIIGMIYFLACKKIEKTKKLTGGLIAVIVLVFLSAPFFGILMFIGFIVLGIGLIKLSNIARIILMVLYVLMIFLDLILLLMGISKFDIGILIKTIIGIVVIIYLNKPNVKSLFN